MKVREQLEAVLEGNEGKGVLDIYKNDYIG